MRLLTNCRTLSALPSGGALLELLAVEVAVDGGRGGGGGVRVHDEARLETTWRRGGACSAGCRRGERRGCEA